jgi:hypothetical protein
MRLLRVCACVAALVFGCSVVRSQSDSLFTGVWKLDLHESKVEDKHPPIASTATIRFDGKVWNFSRTHHFVHKKPDTWAISMMVDSKEDRITREPPLTIKSRIIRDGDALIFTEEYTADTGEKATNSVRYSVTNDGNTLMEDEREVTPDRNEHNVWILKRIRK